MQRIDPTGGLIFALSITWWLAATDVQAARLGEVQLNSALFERLDAQIEVKGVANLIQGRLFVSVGREIDYDGANPGLRAEIIGASNAGGGDHALIKLTSVSPIREPYLGFSVVLRWPQGQLTRQYVVFLDPPSLSQPPKPQVAEKPQQRAEQQPPTPIQPPAPTNAQPPMRIRQVAKGDTLWTIAKETRPGNTVTVQQQMLALKALNPNAFINDNINLLKAGARLKVPAAQDALAVSENAAQQQVDQEEDAWRSTKPQAQTAGRLQIISTRDDDLGNTPLQPVASVNTLAVEALDPISRGVEQVADKLKLVQTQTLAKEAQWQAQLDQKDEQISSLQAQLQQMQQEIEQLAAAQLKSLSKPPLAVASLPANSGAATGASGWWSLFSAAMGILVLLLAVLLVRALR